MDPRLRTAVEQAVNVVIAHAGQTTVHLRFSGDPGGVDFVANAARIQGASFEFQSGFDTYGGSVDELSDIKTEVIQH